MQKFFMNAGCQGFENGIWGANLKLKVSYPKFLLQEVTRWNFNITVAQERKIDECNKK
jgi:hypothetical protein